MSEPETSSATSGEGPSVAAVMSLAPLDVLVKNKRLKRGHDESTEPNTIIKPYVGTGTGSIGQRQLQVRLARLPTHLLNLLDDSSDDEICSVDKSGSVDEQRQLQVRLTRLPTHLLNHFIDDSSDDAIDEICSVDKSGSVNEQRQLQVRLTRLPTHLLNLFIEDSSDDAIDEICSVDKSGSVDEQRQLQVRLTRLPTQLLNHFIDDSSDDEIDEICSVDKSGSVDEQRQLQVRLTRLPTNLLNLFIEDSSDDEIDEICSVDKSGSVDEQRQLQVRLTRLPTYLLNLFIDDSSDDEIDEICSVDKSGAPPSDELKTNGTSETRQIVEHIDAGILSRPSEDANTGASCYTPRKKKKISSRYQTKEVSDRNTDISEQKRDDMSSGKPPNIDQHVNHDSGIQSAKGYSCAKCKYTTAHLASYKLHLQAHFNALNHIRDLCFYIAKIRAGVRPYVCMFCDKKFNQISCFICHMRLHTVN